MIYQAEKDFIEMFLATLCTMNKYTIPFDNDQFTEGFVQASEYFNEFHMKDEMKKKLSPLFIRQTTYGEFLDAQTIIEDMNGRIVSLKNPHFVEATIQMNPEYIQYLYDHDELHLDKSFYTGIASAFCKGAGI